MYSHNWSFLKITIDCFMKGKKLKRNERGVFKKECFACCRKDAILFLYNE